MEPAAMAGAAPNSAEAPPVNGPSPADVGRELGRAVVRGDAGAMPKVADLARAESANFMTNAAGLNDSQRGELSRQTFAPLLAAFDVISDAATKGNQAALDAVVQALQVPELQGPGVQVLGALAGAGNDTALTALLNYKDYQLPLSDTISALGPAASQGNQQAIAALAAVTQDPGQHGYWLLVANGLTQAAASGNSLAVDTLITLAGDSNQNIQRAALPGLRQAAANQNAKAADALRTLGYK
jgi:hypothetical protein